VARQASGHSSFPQRISSPEATNPSEIQIRRKTSGQQPQPQSSLAKSGRSLIVYLSVLGCGHSSCILFGWIFMIFTLSRELKLFYEKTAGEGRDPLTSLRSGGHRG
jgi:hypothetical protein